MLISLSMGSYFKHNFNYLLLLSLLYASQSLATLVKAPASEDSNESTYKSGKFIYPNEKKTGFFKALLTTDLIDDTGKIGVFVGTFRGLISFAWSDLDVMLMADIDQKVVDFNRGHLKLINCIADEWAEDIKEQRRQYIAHLHGFELSTIKFNAPLNDYSYVKRLIKEGAVRIAGNETGPCLKIAQETAGLVNRTSIDIESVSERLFENLSDIRQTLFGMSRVTNESFYWEDNEQWEKITAAIKNNRIAVSKLNIFSARDQKKLRSFVDQTGLDLLVLDISNVLDYYVSNKERATMDLSPYKPKIFFTMSYFLIFHNPTLKEHLPNKLGDHGAFWYYALSYDDFLDFIKKQNHYIKNN